MIDSSRIEFLGQGLQRLLKATVSVVGVGGGGSHIAQQLAHLALGTLVIIDPDVVEASNVNRVVCSSYLDIGRHKALVLKRRLKGLGGNIIPVLSRAEGDGGRAWIERSELVLGAVDGVRTRCNIETICRAALVPYIDIGLKIDVGDDGAIKGIGGQVFVSAPGGPCTRCAGIVTEEGMLLDREEYAVGVPDQQVISLNGVLASQAANTAVALLTGFAPAFPPPRMLRFDGLLHRMLPDLNVETISCHHYSMEAAGWRLVLPKRLASP
jgi:molybdopterin-synthase adenylyltransferase